MVDASSQNDSPFCLTCPSQSHGAGNNSLEGLFDYDEIDVPSVTKVREDCLNTPRDEDLAQRILELSEDQLLAILEQVLRERPWVFEKLSTSKRTSPVEGKKLVEDAPKESCPRSASKLYVETVSVPELPTVQFTASIFYADEGSSEAIVSVIRIGETYLIDEFPENAIVYWETLDGSAKAGQQYVASSGVIEFEPCVTYKEITIPLIDNDVWDPTLDFQVRLNPEGLKNATLHRYHMFARVKIIDDEGFPSNRYKDVCAKDELNSAPLFPLILSYLKLSFRDPVVRSGSIKILILELFVTIKVVALLACKVYLINSVLMPVLEKKEAWDGDRFTAVVLIACVFFIPDHVLHYFQFRKCFWKVNGEARKILQSNLLRKFMSYAPTAKQEVVDAEFILVLFEHIPNLELAVCKGALSLMQQFMLVFAIFFFQSMGSPLLGGQEQEGKWVLLHCALVIVFPVIILSGLACRATHSAKVLESLKEAEVTFTDCAIDIIKNFDLLQAYSKRGSAIDRFTEQIDKFNLATAHHDGLKANNAFIPVSLTTVIRAAWIICGGVLLADTGDIEMGTFLANWTVLQWMGQAWCKIYLLVLEMQEAGTDLRHVTRLMNLTSEHGAACSFLRECDRKTREESKRIADEDSAAGRTSDVIVDKIALEAVDFSYRVNGFEVFKDCSLRFAQGRLHAVVGSRGTGKSTLLRLLGGHFMPNLADRAGDGVLFVPQHLRVLLISKEPLFFRGTLFDNLTYGVQDGDEDKNFDRVFHICKGLNVAPATLQYLTTKEDALTTDWNAFLCGSDCRLLNLARGLIANPEVLIIHKPSVGLGPNSVACVFRAMRKFVDMRGISEDPNEFFFRRPRTCIFSVATEAADKYADEVHYPFGVPARISQKSEQVCPR